MNSFLVRVRLLYKVRSFADLISEANAFLTSLAQYKNCTNAAS